MQAGGLPGVQIKITIVEGLRSPHAGTEHHAKTRALFRFHLEPTRLHGFTGREQRKLRESIELIESFGGKILSRIIVGYLGANLHALRRRIELRDPMNSRLGIHEVGKERFDILPDRCEYAQTCNNHPSHSSPSPSSSVAGSLRSAFRHRHQI